MTQPCIINQITAAENLANDATDQALLSDADIKVGKEFAKERIADPSKKIEIRVVPHEFRDERVKISRVITTTEGTSSKTYEVPDNWQKSKWKPWFSVANRLNRLNIQEGKGSTRGVTIGKVPETFEGVFHEAINKMQTELDKFLDGYKKKAVTETEFKAILGRMWSDSKRRMFSPGKALGTENGKGLSNQLKDYNDHLDSQLGEAGPKANLETFESDSMRYLTPPEKPGLEKPVEPEEVQEWDSNLDQEEYQKEWDRYEESMVEYEKEHGEWVKGEVNWDEESPESLGIWTKFNNAQKDIEGIMSQYKGTQQDLGGGFSVKALRQQAQEAQEMMENMNVSSWDELPDEWFDKIGQLHSEQVSIEGAKRGTQDLINYLNHTADELENELSRLAGHFMRNIEHAEGLEQYAKEMESELEGIKASERSSYTEDGQKQILELEQRLSETEDKIHNMLEGTTTVPFETKQPKTASEIHNEMFESETKQSIGWKGLRDEFRKLQSDNRHGKGAKNPPSDNLKKAREMFIRQNKTISEKEFSSKFAKWLDTKYKQALQQGNTAEKRSVISKQLKVQAIDNLGLGVSPKQWNRGTWLLERKKFRESGVKSEDMEKIWSESGNDVAMEYESWLTRKIESNIDLENPDWVNYTNEYNRLKESNPELLVSKKRNTIDPEWTISNLSNRDGIQGVGKLNDLKVKNVQEISDTAKHDAQTAMEQDSRNVEHDGILKFLDENQETVIKGIEDGTLRYDDLTGDGAKYIKQKLKVGRWDKYIDDWAGDQKRNADGTKKKPTKEELEVLKREYNAPEVSNEDILRYVEQQLIDQESTYNQKALFKYGDNGMNSILPNVNLTKKHSVMTDTGVKLIDSLNNMYNILAEKNKSVLEQTLPQRIKDWEMIAQSLEDPIIPDSVKGLYVHPVRSSEIKASVTPQMVTDMAKKIQIEHSKPAKLAQPDNVSENAGTFEYSENNWQNRIRESNYRRDNAIEKQRLLQQDLDALRRQLSREKKKQTTSNEPPCEGG